MIVNLTTSGLMLSGQNVIEQRLEPVTLRPDICSLDIGSLNFQDRVFINPPEWVEIAARRMLEYGVKPEIEVFDIGHIYQTLDYIRKGFFKNPPYFQLCMGTKWGMEGTLENLLFSKSKLPDNAVWSVLGVGKSQLPMITTAVLLGGNIRVGFEDSIYLKRGILAKSNAHVVEMATNLVHHLQHEEASAEEARVILGLV
jgi:3-keto-5-aminohexanoate cleavage enzyme